MPALVRSQRSHRQHKDRHSKHPSSVSSTPDVQIHITRTIPLDQSTGSSGTILTSGLGARLLPYRLIAKDLSRIRRCLDCPPCQSVLLASRSTETTSQRRPASQVIKSDLEGSSDDYKRKTLVRITNRLLRVKFRDPFPRQAWPRLPPRRRRTRSRTPSA